MTVTPVPNAPEDLPPGWTPAPETDQPHAARRAHQNGHRPPRPPAPHDLDIERQLIAAALAGYEGVAERLVGQVDATDLYPTAHQIIWLHIAALVDEGVTPEPTLLNRRLDQARQLDKIGGTPAILDIAATAPNTANADAYADQVLELAARRRIQWAATQLAEAARDGADTTELIDNLQSGGSTNPPADRLRAALLDTDQLRHLPPPRPLVHGWLNLDTLAMLYGRSGSYKTFLGLDIAAHVATGSWWHGQQVTAAPVLYVIAEGVSGLSKRIDAWQTHHRINDIGGHQPIRWLPQAVNLTDLTEVTALAQVAASLRPGLIVLDTLARCIAGAEENSAKDMGLVVDRLDRIRRATGACVLIVHHSGKDGTMGARGSSALRGAVDTELELIKDDHRIKLKCPKQKDMTEPADIRLGVLPTAESMVLVPERDVADTDDLTPKAAVVLETLEAIALPTGVATTTWREAASENGTGRTTFYESLKMLVDRGVVRNVGTDKRQLWTPSDQDPSE